MFFVVRIGIYLDEDSQVPNLWNVTAFIKFLKPCFLCTYVLIDGSKQAL